MAPSSFLNSVRQRWQQTRATVFQSNGQLNPAANSSGVSNPPSLNAFALCEICLSSLQGCAGFICNDCEHWLLQAAPAAQSSCSQCGEINLQQATPSNRFWRCRPCQQQSPAFDYSHHTALYAGPVMHWIQQAKDKHNSQWMLKLARWMARYPPAQLRAVDRLIPVPSNRWRRWQRGFDPAGVLADELARVHQLTIDKQRLERLPGHGQRGLNRAERLDNIRNSYRLTNAESASSQPLAGQHVMIIDDVMTTGATADGLAQLLKQQGAAIVGVWTLARTPPPGWFVRTRRE